MTSSSKGKKEGNIGCDGSFRGAAFSLTGIYMNLQRIDNLPIKGSIFGHSLVVWRPALKAIMRLTPWESEFKVLSVAMLHRLNSIIRA